MIDTHQHIWLQSEYRLGWISEGSVLDRDFGPEQALHELTSAGVAGSVLVQVADDYRDTLYMLSVARGFDFVKGVVGWLPLDRPDEAAAAAELYAKSGLIKGIRALTHDYEDEAWLLRPSVMRGIGQLHQRGLTLDVCCTTSTHLETVSSVAVRFPGQQIVIDHLGKPEVGRGAWQPWADLIVQAASHPNVHIKLSGLATTSGDWDAQRWQPYVDHAIESFGSRRVMLGSDWPVLLGNGDYGRVWRTQLATISRLSATEQHDITAGTATSFYHLA